MAKKPAPEPMNLDKFQISGRDVVPLDRDEYVEDTLDLSDVEPWPDDKDPWEEETE